MKLTDEKKTVEIRMMTWDDDATGYSPDYSTDFFEAGGLPYNELLDAHEVADVDYCIDQAQDWEAGRGDYEPAEWEDVKNRKIQLNDIEKTPVQIQANLDATNRTLQIAKSRQNPSAFEIGIIEQIITGWESQLARAIKQEKSKQNDTRRKNYEKYVMSSEDAAPYEDWLKMAIWNGVDVDVQG